MNSYGHLYVMVAILDAILNFQIAQGWQHVIKQFLKMETLGYQNQL